MTCINDFYKICDVIREEWRSPAQIREEHFVKVLNFIEENQVCREEIQNYFLKIMNGEIDMPLELVEFCMRKLKWPEIKDAAWEKIQTGDLRILSSMEHVLAVYEDHWDDADLYKYYNQKNEKES